MPYFVFQIEVKAMRPPNSEENNNDTNATSSQNGDNRRPSQDSNDESGTRQRSDTWDKQRTRIDGLLSTLKKEMQEVKVMDKNLTRQFIHLGGKIQELKAVEKQLFEQMSLEGNSFENDDDDLIAATDDTSITVLEDTRL